jgi:N6-adenosine-specific RNA methylase IME4
MTVNRRLAKSHGYYLQHAKEVCMVAVKNPSSSNTPPRTGASAAAAVGEGNSSAFAASAAAVAALRGQQGSGGLAALTGRGVGSDVIFSERRGQSQKPEEIYELIEALVPGGASCSVLCCAAIHPWNKGCLSAFEGSGTGSCGRYWQLCSGSASWGSAGY